MVPVIEGLTGGAGPRCLDRHIEAAVARAALDAGASIVNDMTAFRGDPRSPGWSPSRLRLLPDAHARRAAHDAADPRYGDVVDDVKAFLLAGWSSPSLRAWEERILLDPGIGFGKTSTTTSSCSAPR